MERTQPTDQVNWDTFEESMDPQARTHVHCEAERQGIGFWDCLNSIVADHIIRELTQGTQGRARDAAAVNRWLRKQCDQAS